MSRRSTRVYGKIEPNEEYIAQVSKRGSLHVTYGDSASVDAFGRLRVSEPKALFDSTLTHDKQPLLWNEKLTGTGTSVHLPNESAVLMTVTAAADKVERQSIGYWRYQPGKSQQIFLTYCFGTATSGVRRRVGYFDEENGVFFEEIDGTNWIVLRSKVTGSVVDTRVAQADWNISSRSDFDRTKSQILAIDLEWLGVGRVRVGFDNGGVVEYVHEFLHANQITSTYMTTAQLPVRLEIEAIDGSAGGASMKGVCTAVISEGGRETNLGFPFAVRTGSDPKALGNNVPIISIRPKETFNSIANHVEIILRQFEVLALTRAVAIDIVYNATLTGAVWQDVNAESVVEFDETATAISGGIIVDNFYVPASQTSRATRSTGVFGVIPIGLDMDGANPTIVTVVGNQAEATETDVLAGINWEEYR